MQKNELLFQSAAYELIIPGLLSSDEPEWSFDYENTVKLVIPYQSISTRMIVRLLIRFLPHIKERLIWKEGIILDFPEFATTVIVNINRSSNKIMLSISGEKPDECLHQLQEIILEFNGEYESLVRQNMDEVSSDEINFDFDELISHKQKQLSELTSMKLRKIQFEAERRDKIENEVNAPLHSYIPPPRESLSDVIKPTQAKIQTNANDSLELAGSIVKFRLISAGIIWAIIFLSELFR